MMPSNSQIIFIAVWLYRYVRLIVNIASSWTFNSIPLPDKPRYTSDDVTVMIPTISRRDQHDDLQLCLQSICEARPFEILLITTDDNLSHITKLAHSIDANIRVTAINVANKRRQIAAGIQSIGTKFALLADDDVVWPPQLLPHMLPPFEDHTIGAVGTCQRIRQRHGLGIMGRVWQYLGACYIERRNFEIAATSHIDGGISCLSGRTAAIRTNILQKNEFVEGYINERWQGKTLNADDDNFVTRYLVANGWGIYIQMSKEAEVRTTLECNWGFLLQCLRWARSNLRSNISSMLFERHVWKQQPWSSYALHLATLSHSLANDPLLGFLLHYSTIDWDPSHRLLSFRIFFAWLLFTKVVKLLSHFARYPGDICFLPVTIVFGYFHGFIKLYALFTLHVTTWGGRKEERGLGEKARKECLI